MASAGRRKRASLFERSVGRVLWSFPTLLRGLVVDYCGALVCAGCSRTIRRLKCRAVCDDDSHEHPLHNRVCAASVSCQRVLFVHDNIPRSLSIADIAQAKALHALKVERDRAAKARVRLVQDFELEAQRTGIGYEHLSFAWHEISIQPTPGHEEAFFALRARMLGE